MRKGPPTFAILPHYLNAETMRQPGGVFRYPLHRLPHLSQRGSVEYRLKVNVDTPDTPACLVLTT